MEPSKAPEVFLKPYNPAEQELIIRTLWDDLGYANPDVCIEKGVTDADAEPYSIVLPPPNVTGTLHMGHAAMLAIEDILIRYHRMRGYKTLWVPGTDSAAIATQAKVEDELYKKEKKTRHDIGRDALMERISAFTDESKMTIINQVKMMGSSLDWSRYAYTMDDKRNAAVTEAFVRMYDMGLIYRGDRIVNWDPKLQTTVSDDEIEYKEQKDPFYYFQYGPFVIGTVRPETKFGDKYVVMHPNDERYRKFKHGQHIDLEWINGPITATVIKDEAADMETGSGVMTITPAHSGIDFEIAQRHKLDIEKVIDERGILLPIAGEFAGQHIKKARPLIVAKLKEKGLVAKVDENYVHNIATNSRGGGIIEPQIKRQWFIAVDKAVKLPNGETKSMKQHMHDVVASGQIKIMPERFEKVYYHWAEILRDWCISRQIWFGHRIPAWYKGDETYVGRNAPEGDGWEQDPDVLDTWFSSGLWTFSTLGWPITNDVGFNEKLVGILKDGSKTKTYRLTDKGLKVGETVKTHNSQTKEEFGYLRIVSISETTLGAVDWKAVGHEKYSSQEEFFETFKEYYPDREISSESPTWMYEFTFQEKSDLGLYHPTSVLETGYDILFFWVARMVLMTGALLGEVPFRKVYLHGLVRDAQGRKMSKSLGNIIDPLAMIEKYGADATRLSLVIGAQIGNDLKLSEDRVRGYKNFANKVWNITRFVLENSYTAEGDLSEADQELVREANRKAAEVSQYVEEFRLDLAADAVYHFVWHRFADEILEESKPILKGEDAAAKLARGAALYQILLVSLKLLHPFMPFVTESIWQQLPEKDTDALMVAKWPRV